MKLNYLNHTIKAPGARRIGALFVFKQYDIGSVSWAPDTNDIYLRSPRDPPSQT